MSLLSLFDDDEARVIDDLDRLEAMRLALNAVVLAIAEETRIRVFMDMVGKGKKEIIIMEILLVAV